jgi:hypothetical protein
MDHGNHASRRRIAYLLDLAMALNLKGYIRKRTGSLINEANPIKPRVQEAGTSLRGEDSDITRTDAFESEKTQPEIMQHH